MEELYSLLLLRISKDKGKVAEEEGGG